MARADRAKFMSSCPILLRVACPTLIVWHRLLRVADSAGLGFFKDRFCGYLHITYKMQNKTN